MTHFESDPGSTPAYVGASYVQNGSPFTFGLSTSVGLIEDITDWSTKYSELVAKLIADSGIEPTTHAHRAGVLTSYNSIDGISNIEVKVDNPINLSVATVYLEWDLNGVAQDTYYFSATNPTVDSNGQVPGDLSYYEPGQFETNRERLYNKLIAHIPDEAPLTHDDRAAVLTAYNSIDGISGIEVRIVNEGHATASVYLDWDLNGGSKGFTWWYFSSPNPTVNSSGDVPGDLSALSPEQFETYRERLYNKLTDHILTPAKIRTARLDEIEGLDKDGVTVTHDDGDSEFGDKFDISYDSQVTHSYTSYFASVGKFIEDLTTTEYADFTAKVIEKRDALIPLTPFEEELKAIYDAAEPPTEFVSGGAIVTEALTKGGVNVAIVETFFQKLNSENHGVLAIYDIAPVRVTLTNGQSVYSPYQSFTTGNHNGGKIREWALDIVQALWHLEKPEYLLTPIRKAALIALGNVHEDVTVELFLGGDTWFATIDYPNIEHSNTIVDPSPKNLDEIGAYSETKYNNFVSAIETVIDIYTDPIDEAAAAAAELARLAALKTTRINELEGLGVDNVSVSDVTVVYGSADSSDSFTVDGDAAFGNLKTFSTITYGDNKVENLLPGKYTELKTAVQNKVNELNPLSDYNLEKETTAFYTLGSIDGVGGGAGYGQQLSPKMAAIANAAHASNDNDVLEAFFKNLSKGATHQGLDSYLEWYQDTNIIVTNNGGVSNGFYDIPITDGLYLGAGNHQLKDLGDSNVRHLAYHIMSNFWHLANQDAATLSTFRLQALVAKANSRGWYVVESILDNGAHYYEPRVGVLATFITGFGTLPVNGEFGHSTALVLGDLSAANWVRFYDEWVRKIDESI